MLVGILELLCSFRCEQGLLVETSTRDSRKASRETNDRPVITHCGMGAFWVHALELPFPDSIAPRRVQPWLGKAD